MLQEGDNEIYMCVECTDSLVLRAWYQCQASAQTHQAIRDFLPREIVST